MKVGVIGAGKIGEALISGLIKAGYVKPEDLIASDVNDERRRHIASVYGVKSTKDNVEVARRSEVVIISVKPKDVAGVLEEVREAAERLASILYDKVTEHFRNSIARFLKYTNAMRDYIYVKRSYLALKRIEKKGSGG